MIELRRQAIEKVIRDVGGYGIGVQTGGPHEVYIFKYRGLPMAMYADQIDHSSVTRHVLEVSNRYHFPTCECGVELPAEYKPGMKCFSCIVR